jgi:hypothetical protein
MQEISLYFTTAFQTVMAGKPSGTKAKLAKDANIARSQITGILDGSRYGGSEEVRRAIAAALGWDYEDFLKYGECLVNNKPFNRPVKFRPDYDSKFYAAIPHFLKINRIAIQGGYSWIPAFSEKSRPFLLLKSFLGKHYNSAHLALCKMPDDSMAPTIISGSLMLADTSAKVPEHDKELIRK